MTISEITSVNDSNIDIFTKIPERQLLTINEPAPGIFIAESFKVLVKELQSLCLNVKVLDKGGNEIELKDDEDDDLIPGFKDEEFVSASDSELESEGYFIEDVPEDEFDAGGYEVFWSMLIYWPYVDRVYPFRRESASKLIRFMAENAPEGCRHSGEV